MRNTIFGTLCAVAVAGSIGAGAPVGTATPLGVQLSCVDDSFMCEAYAFGGTGGYTFTWTKATQYESDVNYSAATPHCGDYIGGVYVRVTVRDSSGAAVTVGDGVNCNPY